MDSYTARAVHPCVPSVTRTRPMPLIIQLPIPHAATPHYNASATMGDPAMNPPNSMLAMVLERPLEKLRPTTVPVPSTGAGQVLVRVTARGKTVDGDTRYALQGFGDGTVCQRTHVFCGQRIDHHR